MRKSIRNEFAVSILLIFSLTFAIRRDVWG
jgi:hypothetical protein